MKLISTIIVFLAVASYATASTSDPVVSRTVSQGNGTHKITSIVVRIPVGEGYKPIVCVISEDDGKSGFNSGQYPTALALAQSCDFTGTYDDPNKQ